MMFNGVSKCLLSFLLSILLVCPSGAGSSPNEQLFSSSYRELPNFHLKATQHDLIDSPTKSFSTTPTTNPTTKSTIVPPETTVTIPSTNPVIATPNPASTTPVTNPVATPSTNPVSTNPAPPAGGVPSTTPVTPTPPSTPVTNPITTPSTNPAPPGGGVPATPPLTNPLTPPATPVTNPVTPPATTPPAVQGQTWCVSKTGAQDTALQQALDYACGHAADCSAIQQGGSCSNPNTVQNHASYAFNSFYQKNPSPSSCDFGGTATITNSNPSTGSCMYPSSSSSSSPGSATTSPTPPKSPATSSPTTSTTSPPATVTSNSGSSPTFPNMSNPASGTPFVFGDTPPSSSFDNSTSMSPNLRPLISCIILAITIIKIEIILDV